MMLLMMTTSLWGCSRPEENKGDTPVTDVALADIEKAVAAVYGDCLLYTSRCV